MSVLFRVIYAAHANGTHHKLALDALQRITLSDAPRWQRLFLKHAKVYVEGSKAPDKEFKDFKNHVLHVGDGYWGGAPEKVQSWYAHLVSALAERNWSEAAWCAGVLSHYFTDPIHPFHTAQSTAENNIHRAVEWSINRSYDDLRRLGEARTPTTLVTAPEGPDWLKDFVCRGAERANQDYARLIAHYDINVGVVDPPLGLDAVARDLVADLIVYASDSFARVLERAIAEAGVAPPDVSLTLETVLATLEIPVAWVKKKLADQEDRRIVEAMYDELMATGTVEATLPEDDRMVRDLHAREVAAPREAEQRRQREARLPGGTGRNERPRNKAGNVVAPAAPATDRPLPGAGAGATAATDTSRKFATEAVASATSHVPAVPANRFAAALGGGVQKQPRGAVDTISDRMLSIARASPLGATAATGPAPPQRAIGALSIAPTGESAPTRDPIETARDIARRPHLAVTDDVERAPSIGPKTAQRLAAVGVLTVADLLAADGKTLADRLDVRHITAATIADWQDQARLVIEVPGLRGGHAQLLVGAGYRTADAIGTADGGDLAAAVLAFAMTADGQRILRDGETPDLGRIKGWITLATLARAA
ncbi:MAG: DUF4332 domain-containing protein [Hyphomicrobiaceae bacterium]|nr:DUF4332 domain-containing protein [Hyphomicrobiaceae bacterium]